MILFRSSLLLNLSMHIKELVTFISRRLLINDSRHSTGKATNKETILKVSYGERF